MFNSFLSWEPLWLPEAQYDFQCLIDVRFSWTLVQRSVQSFLLEHLLNHMSWHLVQMAITAALMSPSIIAELCINTALD